MLRQKLSKYNLVLASGSPRRHKFFTDLGLDFEVKLHPIEEVYPKHLKKEQITNYLSKLKAEPFLSQLKKEDMLVTSDTIVWHNDEALGKPQNESEAYDMLRSLSGKIHDVVTSICVSKSNQQVVKHTTTKVTFKALSDLEINHYIDTYKPFDKAGAYGIQEWIGAIGVTHIEGSYNNVVGLPTHLLYETLINITNDI